MLLSLIAVLKKLLGAKITISIANILLVLLFIATLSFSISHFSNKSSSNGPLPIPKFSPLKNYTSKNGEIHSTIPVQGTTDKAVFSGLVDSLKGQLQEKLRTIKELSRVSSSIDTEFKYIPVYIDTTGKLLSFERKDNYIDITAAIDVDKKVADIGLVSKDTLTWVKSEKHPLFGHSTTLIDISNTNPYNHIEAGYSISLEQKKSLIVLGPSLTLGWSGGKSISPMIGISATFPIITIR